MIHPTAVVHPKAKLDPSVVVGPYTVIDGGVEVGAGSVFGPHVYVTGLTSIGSGNRFFAGCVIGEAPQDLKYRNEPTGLRIGNDNVFREHVTVHRSNKPGEDTVLGSRNFLMQHSHVAHNVTIGDSAIIAGGALLAGHVMIADRAFVSGNCLVHQFVRVGTLAMMQGGSGVSKDVPPFVVASGINHICGLNTVGLRRAGISAAHRLELKKLYHFLFRGDKPLREALSLAENEFTSEVCLHLMSFLKGSKRGVCSDQGRGSSPGAVLGEEESG